MFGEREERAHVIALKFVSKLFDKLVFCRFMRSYAIFQTVDNFFIFIIETDIFMDALCVRTSVFKSM